MSIYRVPVHLSEAPLQTSTPSFPDYKTFSADLIAELPEPRISARQIVQRIDDTTFAVMVVVDENNGDGATGPELAAAAVRQALADLQFTDESVRIDDDGISVVSAVGDLPSPI
jgi:hypothetical protein